MEQQSLVRNAADPEQVQEAEEREKNSRDRELDDIYTVLSTVQGRRFFYRYLRDCGIFTTSWADNPNRTFFLEGQRNIGLQMLADMNATRPDAYSQMMNENTERVEGKANGRGSKKRSSNN